MLAPGLLGLGLLFSAAACDESAEQRKPGPTPATAPTGAEAQKPAAPAADAKAPAQATPPGPTAVRAAGGPAPDVAPIVRTYSGCYTACYDEKASATNRETCKLNCDGVAEAALEGLTGAPPKDDFMKALSAFNGCVDACYGDKTLSATNRATCVLTCQDAAEVAASAPPKGADPAAPAAPAAPAPAAAGAQ